MKTTTTILLSFLVLSLFGQKPSLDDREILVKKEYNNEIYQSNPVFDYASIMVPERSHINMNRDTLSTLSAFTPDIDISIKPVAYKTLPDISGHKGFVKLDKGTLNPVYGQAGYAFTAPNYFNINAVVNYDKRDERAIDNKSITNKGLDVGMQYYLTKETKTDLRVSYDRSDFGLYGHELFPVGIEVQNFNSYDRINANLGFQTFKSAPNHWNFRAHTMLSQWQALNTNHKERNIGALGSIEYKVNDVWDFSITQQYQTSLSDTYGNGQILKGSLNMAYNIRNFYANVGVSANHFNDQTRIWPSADIRWQVGHDTDIKIKSQSYATIWGGDNASKINPYISSTALTGDTRDYSFNRLLGMNVASDLNNDVSIDFGISYLNATDDLNFVMNGTDTRQFDYNLVDYEQLRVQIDVTKKIWPELSTGLQVQYDNYAKMSSTLYHRPTVVIAPHVEAQLLNNKLTAGLQATINNPQAFDVVIPMQNESSWRKNISFNVTYKVMNHLNINFNADNILGDTYQVWSGYDNFNRNLSGGILLKL